ncbi:hypothetical protein BAUCODRAFT_24529 [Baudoinia panamericana UAMH 10762]|uniref:AAA+ ATPase domain-containing protein n=1 Tax=Baudoinia panamericana (strain UAMH 10762) TaxID=717646 RepID=M2LQX4_BAUPA|nr:uncharacterized protein BAUCODRAFT_24529 [Baudoinia panamericana UAMH 10762]EMC96832.1 hypothetical protein BAUCODRAFT_24529 [Baudoinia panamericana UAMH 10762]
MSVVELSSNLATAAPIWRRIWELPPELRVALGQLCGASPFTSTLVLLHNAQLIATRHPSERRTGRVDGRRELFLRSESVLTRKYVSHVANNKGRCENRDSPLLVCYDDIGCLSVRNGGDTTVRHARWYRHIPVSQQDPLTVQYKGAVVRDIFNANVFQEMYIYNVRSPPLLEARNCYCLPATDMSPEEYETCPIRLWWNPVTKERRTITIVFADFELIDMEIHAGKPGKLAIYNRQRSELQRRLTWLSFTLRQEEEIREVFVHWHSGDSREIGLSLVTTCSRVATFARYQPVRHIRRHYKHQRLVDTRESIVSGFHMSTHDEIQSRMRLGVSLVKATTTYSAPFTPVSITQRPIGAMPRSPQLLAFLSRIEIADHRVVDACLDHTAPSNSCLGLRLQDEVLGQWREDGDLISVDVEKYVLEVCKLEPPDASTVFLRKKVDVDGPSHTSELVTIAGTLEWWTCKLTKTVDSAKRHARRKAGNSAPILKRLVQSDALRDALSLTLTITTTKFSEQQPTAKPARRFGGEHVSNIATAFNTILTRPAKAHRTYYGIDIHQLLEDAQTEESIPKAVHDLPTPPPESATSKKDSLLWTEKYRARKFTDLIGDERTHRAVMHWLKRWDQIVFPGSYRPKQKAKGSTEQSEEKPHRKILLLTGPPGLGKTTLAHVCAKQAGYEVQEINASDERSAAVVKGRIRDMVGTENVRGVDTKKVDGKVRKAGRPVCVVVDEVDGVVGGSGGGGEGGFVKALIDLIMLDQKNSRGLSTLQQAPAKKKKGERFRLLRPMILICNDVYHPALRPLRQSPHAEVIHVRKAQLQTISTRMQAIFDKEGVPCAGDGVRRLCEAAWGVSSRKEDRTGSGAGEGDMRGIMVVGEWVAGKLRAQRERTGDATLTRRWVEDHILQDLSHGGGAVRGIGRGGPKDIVERVFREGAGFPRSTALSSEPHGSTGVKGVAEGLKRTATDRLRQLIDTHGETDRIITDCFTSYPDHPFQDDTLLSKPDSAYEWLHFHDRLSSAVYSSSEWELAPYLSSPVLALHHLFASPTRAQYSNPATTTDTTEQAEPTEQLFTGPQAAWSAFEATKHNESVLQSLHSALSLELTRSFSSPAAISTDLIPYLLRMLSPTVNPVLISTNSRDSKEGPKSTASVRKASEQLLVRRAVNAIAASGIRFERMRVTDDEAVSWQTVSAQWVYRMEPAIDVLGTFETGGKGFGEAAVAGKQRYAVRQVLEQEWRKEESRLAEVARMARFRGGGGGDVVAQGSIACSEASAVARRPEENETTKKTVIKRDFFGRVVVESVSEAGAAASTKRSQMGDTQSEGGRVWVTFHEGYSNAVRKPITLAELMKDM